MSNAKKITALTALSDVDSADLLAVVDDPSGSPVTKKATAAAVVDGALTALATVTAVSTDEVVIIDDPGGTPVAKVATLSQILGRNGGALTDAVGGTDATIGSLTTTYVKITTFDGDIDYGDVVADSTTDNDITITTAGPYNIDFALSFSGSNATTYTLTLHVNGNPVTTASCERYISTGTDIGSAAFHGLQSLSASDIVTVYVQATGSGKSITVYSGCLRVTAA